MRRRFPLALAALMPMLPLLGCASAAPETPSCRHQDAASERDIGYCQAVRVGHTLHVSGVVAAGPMDAAIRSAYTELKQVLQANGLGFANVVKETVFATDLDAFIRNKAIRKEFYAGTLPAASWVQVQRLYLPSYVVEVELTAEYPH